MQSCRLVDFSEASSHGGGDLPCGPWVFGRVSSAVSDSQDYAAVALDVERCGLMLVGGCVYSISFIIVFETDHVRNCPSQ